MDFPGIESNFTYAMTRAEFGEIAPVLDRVWREATPEDAGWTYVNPTCDESADDYTRLADLYDAQPGAEYGAHPSTPQGFYYMFEVRDSGNSSMLQIPVADYARD